MQPKSPAALKSATAALAEKAEKLYEDGRHSEIYALLKSAVDEARDNTFMRRCSWRAACRMPHVARYVYAFCNLL